MTRDRNDIMRNFCGRVRHFKIMCPLRVKHQLVNDEMQPQQREEQHNTARGQHQRNRGGGRGPVWFSNHEPTSHGDADCRTRKRREADSHIHIAASQVRVDKRSFQRLRPSRTRRSAGTPLASPSQRRRCIPRWQFPRGKATTRKPGHPAHCRDQVLGHLSNAPSPLSLFQLTEIRASPT